MAYQDEIKAAFQAQDYQAAVAVFQNNKEHIREADFINLLATLKMHLGNMEEAQTTFIDGLSLYPRNADMLFNMACVLEKQENFAAAFYYYARAKALTPDAQLERAADAACAALKPNILSRFAGGWQGSAFRPEVKFHSSPYFPYYIVDPDYAQTSSGTRFLHYLCHTLNALGWEAYISATVRSPRLRTPVLTKDIIAQHQKAGRLPIAVYPEVLAGNPYNAAVVARLLLNKAGHLGPAAFGEDELYFYVDEIFLSGEKNAQKMTVDFIDSAVFFRKKQEETPREGFAFYAHKYSELTGKPISDYLQKNGIDLCLHIPRTPQELGDILRRCKVLYCYEPSAIMVEAETCGCAAVYVQSDYLKQFPLEKTAFPAKFPVATEAEIEAGREFPFDEKAYDANRAVFLKETWLSVAGFIERTQKAMDYALQNGTLDGFEPNHP
jgi:tetratricopeptide (TPR) repeat protein